MPTHTASSAQPTDASLTDLILTLCASGRFGVREAITAASMAGAVSVQFRSSQHDDDRDTHTDNMAQARS